MSVAAATPSITKSLVNTFTGPLLERFLTASCVSVLIGKGTASFVHAKKNPLSIEVLGHKTFEFSGGRYPEPAEVATAFEMFKSERALKAGVAVALCIPGDWTVVKTAQLPSSVGENLREVLAFELDRLTPFRSEEALYGYNVIEESADTIEVRIAAAKKQLVGPYLEALGPGVQHLTFEPAAVQALKEPGGPPVKGDADAPEAALGAALAALWPAIGGLDLLGGQGRDTSGKKTPYFLSALLFVLCVTALGFYLHAPLKVQRKLLSDVEAQIALSSREASEVREMKTRIRALEKEINSIEEFKAASPTTLSIVRELTDVTPDNTWLTRLFVTKDKVELQGYSKSAPTLLKLLEKSDLFKKAEFLTTTVGNKRLKADTFSIRVGLEGVADEEK